MNTKQNISFRLCRWEHTSWTKHTKRTLFTDHCVLPKKNSLLFAILGWTLFIVNISDYACIKRQSEVKDSCKDQQWKVLCLTTRLILITDNCVPFSHPTHLTFHLPYSLSQPYDGKFSGFPMLTARSVLISISGLDNTGSPDSWHHMLQKCYFGVTKHSVRKSLGKCRMRTIGGRNLGVNMNHFLS